MVNYQKEVLKVALNEFNKTCVSNVKYIIEGNEVIQTVSTKFFNPVNSVEDQKVGNIEDIATFELKENGILIKFFESDNVLLTTRGILN